MSKDHGIVFPDYTRAERGVDAVIHVAGVVFGIAGTVAILLALLPEADGRAVFSVGVYCLGLVAMLTFSALYNLTPASALKRVLRRLDRASIFVMIAATYTPFAAVKLGGAWGVALLAVVWGAAGLGVLLTLLGRGRVERFALALYLVMGWTVLVAIEPLMESVTVAVLALLLGGGAIYTLGVCFHLWRGLRFHNAIWHGFVLAAAVCHYGAVFVAFAGPASAGP